MNRLMAPLPREGDLAGHYEQLAGRFDANWAYSDAFVSWMTSQICDRLEPRAGDRVLDAGCGTGLYARGLAGRAGSVVCADASAAMLGQLPEGMQLVPVCAAVEDIASGRVALPYRSFDAVLAKEVLHHVPRAERAAALGGLVRVLAPGGRLLVVMLPPVISYLGRPAFSGQLNWFYFMLRAAGSGTR